MRRGNLVRLGRAPANCNDRSPDGPPGTRGGRLSLRGDQVFGGNDCDVSLRSRYQAWSRRSSAVVRVALARRRQMWLLAFELCASAALYRAGGHAAAARQTLRFASWVLLDRAELPEAEEPGATAEGS